MQEEQLSRVACWQGRDRDKASVEPGEENKARASTLLLVKTGQKKHKEWLDMFKSIRRKRTFVF